MNLLQNSQAKKHEIAVLKRWLQGAMVLVLVTIALLSATPASAHHLMGGGLPSNFFEGFMSGIGHPLIGPDHFAFIISVGLLAATKRQGILMPIAFVLTAMLGTAAHLAGFPLPGVELGVAGSIVVCGILLSQKNTLPLSAVTGLSALAGLLHGYAYGETIFGAEQTPLLAYLAGFTLTELVVSLSAFWVSKRIMLGNPEETPVPQLRSAGLVICGVGLAFLSSQLINVLLPVPKG
jgi:urease accessory protein